MGETTKLRELYESRQLAEAWSEYERLRAEGPLDAAGHLLGGLVARLRGDLPGARTALERAEQLKSTGTTRGKLLMTFGVVLREIGETGMAIDHLQEFLSSIEDYPELGPVAVASCWYNLGLAYRCARRMDDAVYAYEMSAKACRRDDLPDLLRRTLQNLAWVYCLMGRPVQAEQSLAEAHDLCDAQDSIWQQRLGMAFLESISGEKTSALRRCDTIIGASDAAPAEVVSHACWVAGRVALSLNQVAEADSLAGQAMHWALRVPYDTRQIHDANALRREIHQLRIEQNHSGA